jgi:hypothetical protein
MLIANPRITERATTLQNKPFTGTPIFRFDTAIVFL